MIARLAICASLLLAGMGITCLLVWLIQPSPEAGMLIGLICGAPAGYMAMEVWNS